MSHPYTPVTLGLKERLGVVGEEYRDGRGKGGLQGWKGCGRDAGMEGVREGCRDGRGKGGMQGWKG